MNRIILSISLIGAAISSFGQLSSTPCTASPLSVNCTANSVDLTSSMTNSGVTDPQVENGTGCSSVGSDITAGTIYDYDGWFTTTADAAGVVDVYAAIITGDPVVGLYSGPCSSPTLLTCDDDGGSGLDAYINQTGLTPGGTYYVRVWDYSGGTGTYEVTTNGGTPPANDDCSSASGLTLNGAPTGGTTYCATVETSDWNDCEANTENNVWYSFTTTVDGDITVNFTSVDCFGSGAGLDVTVFYGNCSSFASYGCTSVATNSTGSIPEFTGPAGTYYVMVDGNNSGGATSLCDFDVDVDFIGCTANGGTNTSPALITNCAGNDVTSVSATGTVDTYLGTDPCIGWGYWVASDPLGVYAGMTGIGDLPTGNNPASSGNGANANPGDPNYLGVFTSTSYPLANGETPTLPDLANGVTYYIAPITLSNCAIGEITTNCFDIGNVTQLYYNPQIVYTTVIDCFDNTAPGYTQVQIAIAGGTPSVDGSNFTITNLGDGTLSSTTVADGGIVTVTNIPNGGDFDILITDASGCTESVTISAIDATAYCTICGADAGTYASEVNSSATTSPIVLCFGDVLDIIHNDDFVLPADLNVCGDPPGVSTFNGSTAGSCNPDVVYGIFTGLATTANPFDDAAFSGFGFPGDDQTFTNDGGLIAALIASGVPIVDNTFILYPVTAEITGIDMNGDGNPNWAEDYDGDGCVDSGIPISITMLNEIQANAADGCAGPQITITGGYPEFFPGNYTITNNGGGTITGLPVTHNGTITITGLNDGDPYDITITDGNGCSINYTGTYNFTQPTPAINGLATEFCIGDAVDAFTTTPSPVTATTGTFDIDVTSDGWSSELSFEIFDASGTSVWTFDLTTDYTAGTSAPTITTSALTAGDGPFTLVISDSYGDGESASVLGQTVITNNITGATMGTTSGNWGTSITINLFDFYSLTSTLTGTSVTDNGDGTGSFDPNIVGTHDVVFTYSSNEGCTYYDSVEVTVHQVPLLASTINPEVCAGETILLSDYTPGEANGVAGTGTWYTNAGFTTPASTGAITPSNGDQFYYQYVTTAGSCADDASITVTVNPLPIVTVSSTSICEDESITLSPTTGGSWISNNTSVATVTAGGVVTVVADGTIDFTFTESTNNCSATTSLVTISPLPVVSISSTTICEDETVTLSPTTGGTWTSNNTSVATVTAAGVVTIVADGTVDFTFEESTNNCTATTSTLTVNPSPVVTVSATSICEDGSITLTPTTGGTWTSNNTSVATVTAAGVVTIVADGSVDFTFEESTNNCTATTSTVTVNPLPVVSVSSTTICEDGTLTLTPTTGGTWTSNNTSVATVTAAGIVTIVADGTVDFTFEESTNNCTATTNTVTVNPTPVVSVSTTSICEDGTITLTPTTGGTWTSNNTSVATVTAAGVVTIIADGSVDFTFEESTNNCTATTSTVTINPLPVLGSVTDPEVCANTNTIDLSTLTPAETAGVAGTGQWYTGNNNTGSPVSGTQTVSDGDEFYYEYTSTAGSCTDGHLLTVTVNPVPVLSNPTDLCINDTQSITPSSGGTWVSNNTSIATIDNSGNITAVGAGTVNFTFTDGTTGCVATTINMTVFALPSPTTSDVTICEDQSLTLAGGPAGLTYAWSGPNSYNSTAQNPTVSSNATPGMSGSYQLTVTDGNNCSASTTANVTVNALPTIDDSGVSLNDPSACGATDGSITGIVGVGTATISYSWNGGAASTVSGDLTGIGASSNFLLITDGNGCTASAGPYSISDPSSPTPPTLTPSSADACFGQSVTISVSSPDPGATYTWSGPNGYSNTGSSITINNLTSNEAGNYDVSTTISGCTTGNAAAPAIITVNDLPIVDILAPVNIDCNNPVISLDGSNSSQGANFTYTWSTGNGGALIGTGGSDLDSTSTAGDYTLIIENTTTGCIDSSMVSTIVNNDTPTAVASTTNGGQLDCSNNALILDGTSSTDQSGGTTGITYEWFDGATLIANTSTHTINAAGTYTLVVTETSSGCTDQVDIMITQDANLPSAIINGSTILTCDSTTVTINGSASTGGTLDYEWFDDAALTNSLGTNVTYTVNATGTYYLEVTNPTNGCTSDASIVITQDITAPSAIVVSPVTIDCNNPVVQLDGSSSDVSMDYSWTAAATGVIIGTADATIDSASIADTYTLTVTNPINGCSATADVIVNEDLVLPNAEAGTNVNFPCGVTTVQLDGSASTGTGITFDWTGAGNITNGTTATPDVDQSGMYYLTVTGSNGCSAIDSAEVIPDSNLPIADAGVDLTFDCNNTLPVTLDGSGSDSGVNYTYSWSTTGTGNITNGTTTTPSVDQAGTYTIQVTNTSNGCINNASVTLTADTTAPVAIAGTDTTLNCTNSSIDLDAAASTGTGLTFNWTTLDGNITSQSNSIASIDASGTYTLTATGSNGCTDSDDVIVTLDTISPVVSIDSAGGLNCNVVSLVLNTTVTADPNATYSWTTTNGNITSGNNTASATIDQAGDYNVTVTNDNGCSSTSVVTITQIAGPIASISANPTSGQIPLDVQFTDASTGTGLTYSWDFGDGNVSTIDNPMNTYEGIGEFEAVLTVTDVAGCTSQDSLTITTEGNSYLIVPNIFSPNGDGVNDQFNLDGSNIIEVNGIIMNRWGDVIYEWDGLKSGWDGYTLAGVEASSGTYFYIITAEGADGKNYEFAGHFSLVK